jgi:hypothetical protein
MMRCFLCFLFWIHIYKAEGVCCNDTRVIMPVSHLPAIGWVRSELATLTHFSVLTGLVVVMHGGDFLPFLVCYMAGIVLVALFVAWYFYCMHANSSAKLAFMAKECHEVRVSVNQLDECERKLMQSVTREQAHARVLNVFKKALECPILCEVPRDPIVTSTGYVCSLRAMTDHSRYNRGFFSCPIRGCPLYPEDVLRCYPVIELCNEIRLWDESV